MKKMILFFLLCFSFLCADREGDLKKHVCNELPHLHGWCTTEKALNFIDLVLEVQPEVCVDIGTFGGRSLFPVASALKFLGKGIVIGIDPWDKIECLKHFEATDDPRHIDWWGKIDFNQIYRGFVQMLQKHNLEKYCKALKTTSEKASSQIESIDILYIDGNHAEHMVTQDVQLYLPKVRKGGYIWLNDTTWTAMQPAIELLTEGCDVIKLIENGNCILFKKK
jgi:hypothetical protein